MARLRALSMMTGSTPLNLPCRPRHSNVTCAAQVLVEAALASSVTAIRARRTERQGAPRRLTCVKTLLALVLVAVFLTACGEDGDEIGSITGGGPGVERAEQDEQRRSRAATEPGTVEPAGTAAAEVLSGLSIELVGPLSVRPGGELMTTLHVENRSGGPVIDPGCQLGSTAHALVPVDNPGAELRGITVVDCGGPFTYEVGAVEDFAGPTFVASTKVGDPLPPGNYHAAVEIDGQRLAYPVEITSP